MQCYYQILGKVHFGNYFWHKTQTFIILIEEEWASNWKKYTQKYGWPYSSVFEAIYNHYSIIVDAVLQQINSESTFGGLFLIQNKFM